MKLGSETAEPQECTLKAGEAPFEAHRSPPVKDMTSVICYCDVCECVTVEECSSLECGCCTRALNRRERRSIS